MITSSIYYRYLLLHNKKFSQTTTQPYDWEVNHPEMCLDLYDYWEKQNGRVELTARYKQIGIDDPPISGLFSSDAESKLDPETNANKLWDHLLEQAIEAWDNPNPAGSTEPTTILTIEISPAATNEHEYRASRFTLITPDGKTLTLEKNEEGSIAGRKSHNNLEGAAWVKELQRMQKNLNIDLVEIEKPFYEDADQTTKLTIENIVIVQAGFQRYNVESIKKIQLDYLNKIAIAMKHAGLSVAYEQLLQSVKPIAGPQIKDHALERQVYGLARVVGPKEVEQDANTIKTEIGTAVLVLPDQAQIRQAISSTLNTTLYGQTTPLYLPIDFRQVDLGKIFTAFRESEVNTAVTLGKECADPIIRRVLQDHLDDWQELLMDEPSLIEDLGADGVDLAQFLEWLFARSCESALQLTITPEGFNYRDSRLTPPIRRRLTQDTEFSDNELEWLQQAKGMMDVVDISSRPISLGIRNKIRQSLERLTQMDHSGKPMLVSELIHQFNIQNQIRTGALIGLEQTIVKAEMNAQGELIPKSKQTSTPIVQLQLSIKLPHNQQEEGESTLRLGTRTPLNYSANPENEPGFDLQRILDTSGVNLAALQHNRSETVVTIYENRGAYLVYVDRASDPGIISQDNTDFYRVVAART